MSEVDHQGSGKQGRGLQVDPGAGQHETVIVRDADVLFCKCEKYQLETKVNWVSRGLDPQIKFKGQNFKLILMKVLEKSLILGWIQAHNLQFCCQRYTNWASVSLIATTMIRYENFEQELKVYDTIYFGEFIRCIMCRSLKPCRLSTNQGSYPIEE